MDQLDAMRVFAAVADSGSFSETARLLGVPVATVSRKIAALERHLGARLVSRSTRQTGLTDLGRDYQLVCKRVLSEIDEADRGLARSGGELYGPLSVTAPVVFGRLRVLPIVSEFLRSHPRVDVRLALSDGMVDLIEGGMEVAIRIAALPDSSMMATRVGSVRRLTCASPAYLRERGTPERPEDLAKHDCITFSMLASPERWLFPIRKAIRGVAIRSRLSVTTADAAIDAACAGLGITRVLSYQVATEIAAGRLVPILERFEPQAIPVNIVHSQGRSPGPKVREFVGLATNRLRQALRNR